MSITFSVIDTTCEAADQSFFVPQIRMQCVSTTSYATLYGYSEFIPSDPPKKYKKVTWTGLSERIAFTMEETPRQCGGAKYTWTGVGEYNSVGTLIQSYSKKFFAQCSKQYWPVVPLQNNSFATNPASQPFPSFFVGYCWPADLQSCSICDPNIVNWPFISEQTTNNLQVDLGAFKHNSQTVTNTSYVINDQVFGFFALASPAHTFTPTGHHYNVAVGSTIYDVESVFTNPTLPFPVELVSGFEGAYVNFADANNYSAVLSDEYTDAEAALNAQIVTGTGCSATNQPRDTGFTTVTTSVVFTLFCSNLISGKDYVVTVDKWNQSPQIFEQPPVSIHTLTSYGFTASGPTHTITDTIPVPADPFSTITVRDPTIVFVV